MAVYRPTYKDKATGETRTAATWWFSFSFAGRRIRESAHTTRKTIAVEAEKKRRLELERVMAGLPVEKRETRINTVADVVEPYLANHPLAHRPNTTTFAKNRLEHISRLLGGRFIMDLTEETMQDYMRARVEEGASGRTINAEVGELSRAMGRTWRTLWPKLRLLEERKDVGQALEGDAEAKLFKAAKANPSHLIYPYLQVLAWTGLRSSEARVLRWQQIDFEGGTVTVGHAKSAKGKGRVIPMSAALRASLEHHAAWCASKLGPIQQDWHVFPGSNRLRPIDPSKPATSLKTAWNTVRRVSGVRIRLHDWRHTFCTKLAEAGVPESTMLDMMGHMSAAMLRKYSHIRAQARRDAIDAVEALAEKLSVKESAKVGAQELLKSAVTH